jgi:Uma2 family endonuclease
MRIPSLREYVLVSQNEHRIEVFRRPDAGGHWLHEVRTAGETLMIVGRQLEVDDIFSK